MSKYSYQEDEGGNFEVFRDDVHLATYDPASEEVTYTKPDNKRFAKPIADVVLEIVAGEPKSEDEPSPPVEEPLPKPLVEDTELLVEHRKELNREITRLKVENARLQTEVNKFREKDNPMVAPERFRDKFDDSDAPAKNPQLGDMTPEYIEWAKENMPKEIFEKRYRGRIRKK